METKKWVVGFVLLALVEVAGSIPIPRRYDGFVFDASSSSSPVLLEAFFDPLCSDSADAWPVVKKIAQYFQDDLLLIVHPFPLPYCGRQGNGLQPPPGNLSGAWAPKALNFSFPGPIVLCPVLHLASYHHNAFFACRALHIINNLNSSLTYPLLELFFENQDSFSTSQTLEEAPSSVVERIVQLTVNAFNGLVSSTFESKFKAGFSDTGMDLITRVSFKFGCSRVVVGTPYFFVNGIPLYDADSSWTFSQWADIIQPLLDENATLRYSGLGNFKSAYL